MASEHRMSSLPFAEGVCLLDQALESEGTETRGRITDLRVTAYVVRFDEAIFRHGAVWNLR